MSTPTPDTPTPDEAQEHPGPDVDAEVSTSSVAGEPKKARKLRRPLIVVGVLVLALIGWIIYDQVRAPDPAPAPPPSSSQPASTTPVGPSEPGADAAVQTVLDYVTLSYAGKWDQACKLRTDQAICVEIGALAPTRPLTRPATVLKEETYPAQGAAGQAYTGVLISAAYEGAKEPALLAYLVNQQNLIAGKETVTSDEAKLTLRQILDRHIK